MPGTAQFDFSGETAIVTGSSRGIGNGIARELAAAGADVVVNSRSEDRVASAVEEIRADANGEVVGIPGDVSDPDDIEMLVAGTLEELGTPTLLVNNAAVWAENPLREGDLEDWDFVLGVNARGPFYLSALVAEELRASDREGSIVNVTSAAGERTAGTHGLYGVSKATMTALTWRLAADLAPDGIRVNAVSTSMTDSYQLRTSFMHNRLDIEDPDPEAMTEDQREAAYETWGEDVPLGRVGQPEDLADGVLFLASDAASYVTGHVLRVSGGRNVH